MMFHCVDVAEPIHLSVDRHGAFCCFFAFTNNGWQEHLRAGFCVGVFLALLGVPAGMRWPGHSVTPWLII